jgi:hypothetical protein
VTHGVIDALSSAPKGTIPNVIETATAVKVVYSTGANSSGCSGCSKTGTEDTAAVSVEVQFVCCAMLKEKSLYWSSFLIEFEVSSSSRSLRNQVGCLFNCKGDQRVHVLSYTSQLPGEDRALTIKWLSLPPRPILLGWLRPRRQS